MAGIGLFSPNRAAIFATVAKWDNAGELQAKQMGSFPSILDWKFLLFAEDTPQNLLD